MNRKRFYLITILLILGISGGVNSDTKTDNSELFTGKSLDDFVPKGWQVITPKSYPPYGDQARHISPVKRVYKPDFNADGKADIIALIGQPSIDKTAFDNLTLLVLQATADGFVQIHQLAKDISSHEPPGSLPISSEVTISNDEPNTIEIRHWASYDNNTSHSLGRYDFKYKDGRFQLAMYKNEVMHFAYSSLDSRIEDIKIYDLINKTMTVYDNHNRMGCMAVASGEVIPPCPPAYEEKHRLDANSIPLIDLSNIKTLKMDENFEKTYGIKRLKTGK